MFICSSYVERKEISSSLISHVKRNVQFIAEKVVVFLSVCGRCSEGKPKESNCFQQRELQNTTFFPLFFFPFCL